MKEEIKCYCCNKVIDKQKDIQFVIIDDKTKIFCKKCKNDYV